MKKATDIIGNAYLTAKFNPRCAIGYKHIMSLYDENFGEEEEEREKFPECEDCGKVDYDDFNYYNMKCGDCKKEEK